MSFRYPPPSDGSSDTEADLLFELSVEISLDKLVRSVAADCEAVSVLDSSSDEPLLFPGLKRAACPLLPEGSNSVYCSSIALCFMGSRSSRARCNRSRSSGSKSRNIAYTRAGSTGGQYSVCTGQQPRCTCTGVRIWVPLKYSVLHPYWVFEYLCLVGKDPIVFIVGRLPISEQRLESMFFPEYMELILICGKIRKDIVKVS